MISQWRAFNTSQKACDDIKIISNLKLAQIFVFLIANTYRICICDYMYLR